MTPAKKLLGCTLKDGWKVVAHYTPGNVNNNFSSPCYIVQKGSQKGFLKAFDYSDLKKAGGKDQHKRLAYKFNRELSMLQKCKEKKINSVITLLANDQYYFRPDDLNELVEYFILEYSNDGNVLDCLSSGNLNDFENKFQALVDIFDGLNDLHTSGIMHLDIKTENLLHFVRDRMTKITDFGSARQLISDIDEDLLDDLNNITTTRQYAPPECLYNDLWTNDWKEYRRKIDLYLVGNVIVKLFTNFSFTTLLKSEVSEVYDWNISQNVGRNKLQLYMPHLMSGAAEVYILIEEKLREINTQCDSPLDDKNLKDLMKIISQLCKPDALYRGHPKELIRRNNRDGLDRYRDKFITLRNICSLKKK